MDNLPDIPMVFPPLPSSRSSSRAPLVVALEEDPSQTLLLLPQFLQEMCDRHYFSLLHFPIPHDSQLCHLSDGETILIPFLCSALNVLKAITCQLDTLTTQMGNILSMVSTLPTFPAMESALSPINASIRDLSHRMTLATAPAPAPATSRAGVPPAGTTWRAVPPPLPRPRAPSPKATTPGFDCDIPRYDPVGQVLYRDPRAYGTKFPD